MSALPLNLVDTAGFLVADNRGRVIGKVECPMYGTLPDVPDALADVDRATKVVGLRVARETIRRFL
jgi:hypothetical protein